MKIGLLLPFTETTAGPADFARKAEALGFESLWVPEHPILPVNPATKFPSTGGEIPKVYSHMGDQLVALAIAGAATAKLKLATGICLVPEHNPIVLANQLASLDCFSGGRLVVGIGAGWLREESELLGVDFPRRWTQTAEYVAAMRELWRKPEASFAGKYVKFTPVRLYPKPAAPAGPPIVIGSLDKNALKRVAKWGDGWCPIGVSPDYLKRQLAALKDECQAAGRDFSRLDITVMGGIPGDRAKVQEGLKSFAGAGAHRYVAGVGAAGPNDYEAELNRLAGLYL